MKYQLILMDADGTLFDYDKAEGFALENTFKSFALDYQQHHLTSYRQINSKLWADLEVGKVTKDKLKTHRFKELALTHGFDIDEQHFSDKYLSWLGQGNHLLDGAEELCRYLHDKCKLVIVTNGIKEVQLSRLATSTLKNYIHDIIISEEIGINKPDPRIFQHTLEKIGYNDKQKTLIVGDSLSADIQGGINFGIDTCWYNPLGKHSNNIIPTYEIGELRLLKDIIEGR